MPTINFDFRVRGAGEVQRAVRAAANEASRLTGRQSNGGSQEQTRALLREVTARRKAAQTYQETARRIEENLSLVVDREARRRGRSVDNEFRERTRAALAFVAAHGNAERRVTANVQRATRERARVERAANAQAERSNRAVLGGARRLAVEGLQRVGDYGDTVRTQNERQRGLRLSATQIAAGDIGDATASSQLLDATQRTSLSSGLAPEAVMSGLNRAQSRFSALGDAASRASYLERVLPKLAQIAVATNTPLEAVVDTAGEMQRQLGIDNSALSDRLAQIVVQGRNGAIAFQDQAQHLGVIGGAATRFLGSSGAASAHSMATTGALFQMAGRAGGSGDEAATRARAFLDNFSSARGQRRLTALLGHRVLDRSGQVITRDGETQSDAFQRILEEAYRRSGGNSDRFLTGIAGVNTRARSLGDQLFKDMQRHGGKTEDLAALTSGSASATFENTITPAFQAVRGTEAMQQSARDNAMFYQQTATRGRSGNFAEETRMSLESLRGEHPFLASMLDNPVTRGAMDLFNMTVGEADVSRLVPTAGRPRTRGDLLHQLAQQRGAQQMSEAQAGLFGTIGAALTPDSVRSWMLNNYTSRNENELRAKDREAGRNPDQPLRLAPETVAAIGTAVGQAVASPQAALHAAGVAATGANSLPPEARASQ